MWKYPFSIIYEDNHLLIVNKPVGLLCQGDNTGDKTLIDFAKDYIKEKYNKPGAVFLGLVHRLDRPVSGLVVLAKTSKALERMSELFRRRDVQKTYYAVVKEDPKWKEGKLVNWLIKDEKLNKTTAFRQEVPNAQKAELNFKLIGKLNEFNLIEVNPITGRPHQIRVQLSDFGCPIRGDLKYGYPKANPDGGINLHARRLFFEHPIKKEPMVCLAPFPQESFWEQFYTLESLKVKEKNVDYYFG